MGSHPYQGIFLSPPFDASQHPTLGATIRENAAYRKQTVLLPIISEDPKNPEG